MSIESTSSGQDAFSVSVVIPTYNSRLLVVRAVESVLAQTRPAAEIVVVDDGSQDGTGDELRSRFGEGIRYAHQPNTGPAAARNHGIRLSRSRWIAFLDADDTWYMDKLEKQAAALERLPEAVMVASGCVQELPDGTRVGETKLPWPLHGEGIRRELLHRTVFPMNGVVVRRDVLDRCGGFDTALRCAEDRDLWIRVAKQGPVTGVHAALAVQLMLPDSVSTDPVRTLRDTLTVNRRAAAAFADLPGSALARAVSLRRADARVYFSVAWLLACRGLRWRAMKALVRSLVLLPWPGRRDAKRRAGLLFRLIASDQIARFRQNHRA